MPMVLVNASFLHRPTCQITACPSARTDLIKSSKAILVRTSLYRRKWRIWNKHWNSFVTAYMPIFRSPFTVPVVRSINSFSALCRVKPRVTLYIGGRDGRVQQVHYSSPRSPTVFATKWFDLLWLACQADLGFFISGREFRLEKSSHADKWKGHLDRLGKKLTTVSRVIIFHSMRRVWCNNRKVHRLFV